MANDALTFAGFSAELMERSHGRMKQALDGLTDEQLYFQPTEASNPIGWLVWHLSRWKDIQTGAAAGQPEVWVSEGWAGRFNLPASANGNGDALSDVAAFRAERDLLMAYAEAAHEAAMRRVRGVSSEQLTREVASAFTGRTRPAWHALIINAIDYTEHTGQIAYLRGMLTGPGWL